MTQRGASREPVKPLDRWGDVKARRAVIHSVDRGADTYRTVCGLNAYCNVTVSVIEERVNCKLCRQEHRAREVESTLSREEAL